MVHLKHNSPPKTFTHNRPFLWPPMDVLLSNNTHFLYLYYQSEDNNVQNVEHSPAISGVCLSLKPCCCCCCRCRCRCSPRNNNGGVGGVLDGIHERILKHDRPFSTETQQRPASQPIRGTEQYRYATRGSYLIKSPIAKQLNGLEDTEALQLLVAHLPNYSTSSPITVSLNVSRISYNYTR